jgi:hypothetical protein
MQFGGQEMTRVMPETKYFSTIVIVGVKSKMPFKMLSFPLTGI